MDPLTDFDRALREALRVEPSGDFTARIRARVAESPRESRLLVPRLALVVTGAVLAVIVASVWRETDTTVRPPLPHRDLMVVSAPSQVPSSPPLLASPAVFSATDVVVSRSEMQALQQLFSGVIVAPPPLLPPAIELSIPELAIAPLSTSIPEGERQ